MEEQKVFHGVIYQAINIQNGKSYIGKTTKDFEKYKNFHIRNALRNIDCNKKLFYQAIRKYKEYNFKWIILGQIFENSLGSLNNKLNEAEIESIWLFQSNNSLYGYNMTKGGDGISKGTKPWNKGLGGENYPYKKELNPFYNKKHTLDTIKLISKKAKLRHKQGQYNYDNVYVIIKKDSTYEESLGQEIGINLRHKRSQAAKERHENNNFWKENKNPFMGKSHTIETKQKMSEKAKNRPPVKEETKLKISKKNLERSEIISKRNSGVNNGRFIYVDVDLILTFNKEGKSNKEIASILGVSIGIIKTRISNPDKWR